MVHLGENRALKPKKGFYSRPGLSTKGMLNAVLSTSCPSRTVWKVSGLIANDNAPWPYSAGARCLMKCHPVIGFSLDKLHPFVLKPIVLGLFKNIIKGALPGRLLFLFLQFFQDAERENLACEVSLVKTTLIDGFIEIL